MGRQEEPLQLLMQYNNMKKASEETVQEFSARFMKVYNSIPAEVQPPPGAVQLRYADSFDNDFALLLRERRSTNLDAIMSNTDRSRGKYDGIGEDQTKIQQRR
jgi:hypothetical protein